MDTFLTVIIFDPKINSTLQQVVNKVLIMEYLLKVFTVLIFLTH